MQLVETRNQRLAQTVLVLLLVGLGLYTLRNFLSALAWAVILSIAFWPLYRRVEARWPARRGRVLLPGLFTLAVIGVFVTPLALVAFEVGREAHDIAFQVESVRATGLPVPDWVAHLPVGGPQVSAWWGENLADNKAATNLLRRLDTHSVYVYTREAGRLILRRLVIFAFAMMALFFIFSNARSVRRQLILASQVLFGVRGERIARQMVLSVHGTLDGLVLVGLGEGLILGIAYWAGGVPHPALLGGLTAIAAMVPFGAPVVFLVAAAVLLAQGAVGWAIAIVALGFVVLGVADHVVRPALIGGATRLPFLWVLLGILGGVESFGLLGLFLGPAIMSALILLWRELIERPAGPAEGAPAVLTPPPGPAVPIPVASGPAGAGPVPRPRPEY